MAVELVICFVHKEHDVRVGLQEGLNEIHSELLPRGVAWRGDLDHLGLVQLYLRLEVIWSQTEGSVLDQLGMDSVHPVEEVHLSGHGGQHHVVTFYPRAHDLGQCVIRTVE